MLQPSVFKGLRQPEGYPSEFLTIGDHLLAVRLERNLQQKVVAKTLGVDAHTYLKWEKNGVQPLAWRYPNIADFLGYCPVENITSLGDKIRVFRFYRGLTLEAAARLIGIDPGTLGSYEKSLKHPSEVMLERLNVLLS